MTFLPLKEIMSTTRFGNHSLMFQTIHHPIQIINNSRINTQFQRIRHHMRRTQHRPLNSPHTRRHLPNATTSTSPVTFISTATLNINQISFRTILIIPYSILNTPNLHTSIMLARSPSNNRRRQVAIISLLLNQRMANRRRAPLTARRLLSIRNQHTIQHHHITQPLRATITIRFNMTSINRNQHRTNSFVRSLQQVPMIRQMAGHINRHRHTFPIDLTTRQLRSLTRPQGPPFNINRHTILFRGQTTQRGRVNRLHNFIRRGVLRRRTFRNQRHHHRILNVQITLNGIFTLTVRPLRATTRHHFRRIQGTRAQVKLRHCIPHLFRLHTRRLVKGIPMTKRLIQRQTRITQTLGIILPARQVSTSTFTAGITNNRHRINSTRRHHTTLAILNRTRTMVSHYIANTHMRTNNNTSINQNSTTSLTRRFQQVVNTTSLFTPADRVTTLTANISGHLVRRAFNSSSIHRDIRRNSINTKTRNRVRLNTHIRQVRRVGTP